MNLIPGSISIKTETLFLNKRLEFKVKDYLISYSIFGKFSVLYSNAELETIKQELKQAVKLHCQRGKRCYYCRTPFWIYSPKNETELNMRKTHQHILPKRRGGKNYAENLKFCCRLCNHVLNGLNDCPALLFTLSSIGEKKGYGTGAKSAEKVARELKIWQKH